MLTNTHCNYFFHICAPASLSSGNPSGYTTTLSQALSLSRVFFKTVKSSVDELMAFQLFYPGKSRISNVASTPLWESYNLDEQRERA
jgi:hypothetical protein